eukprot:785697-Prorocentrum_minimum.AAC.1
MYKRAACPLRDPKKGPNPKVHIGRRNPAKKAGGIGFVGGVSGGKRKSHVRYPVSRGYADTEADDVL